MNVETSLYTLYFARYNKDSCRHCTLVRCLCNVNTGHIAQATTISCSSHFNFIFFRFHFTYFRMLFPQIHFCDVKNDGFQTEFQREFFFSSHGSYADNNDENEGKEEKKQKIKCTSIRISKCSSFKNE